MERADLWYFSKERLERTPSRENGIEAEKELSLRQQAANFIQDIGQCLAVSQLCINTAIVYMHRFYMFHSFTKFHRFKIASCAMFLAAKVEEQPRKMEHVLKISHICLHKNDPPLDVTSPAYLEKQAELVSNENIMLQTLGFVIGIDHPHTYIVKLCQLVKASKDLAQTSYFMATNSLHLTTMCLQYKPTVVACVCIHLACKWADWKIAPCSEGKEWYYYVDKTVTLELLEELTNEFVKILKEYPNKIRRKVSFANGKEPSSAERKKLEQTIGCIEKVMEHRPDQSSDPNKPKNRSPESSSSMYLDAKDDFPSTSSMLNCTDYSSAENSPSKKSKSETTSSISITLADYREKRDKGRLEKKNAHLEIPSGSQRQNAAIDKHSRPLVNHEKPQHPLPYTKPEFSMQRVVEKSNKPSSEFNPSAVDKFNHQSTKLPTVNESHHQEPKFIAPIKSAPEIKTEPQGNKVDHPSRDTNKDILPHPDSTESFSSSILPAPPRLSDVEQSVTVRLPHDKRTHNLGPERTNQKLPDISLHNKANKVKHPKHKPASQSPPPPRNSHGEPLSASQDNGVLKQSSDWDSAKSCSSKREPCVVIEHKAVAAAVAAASAAAAEQIRVPEKTPEPPVKHERKERHKHKHSVHSSSKDKSSRNREPPPPDQNLSGGLKITIPKDKIVLSGVRPDSSQKINLAKPEDKRCLKIKLPKPKIACNDAPQPPIGLKLVLTKDKNAGSYSASHKPDKVSRKRDHSPKDHSSKNSESGKPSKLAKLEESQKSFHQEGYHAPIAALPPEQKISRHFHHSDANQFVSAGSKKNPSRGYHHVNDSSIAPAQYVMQYGAGGQPYYQQYSQPQTNIGGSGYQNKMVHVAYDHTKLPPPPPDVPPLPKDPPPPLPPQPPPPEY